MAQAPEPLDPSFQLRLTAFEGPLDLLLHLVQKHELEILDLPVAFVTEKYLEYLGVMQELNLDVASEYLVMAATLAHIKSKMLLPPDPNAAPDDDAAQEELDPRAELIRRLLEYQKYKTAGADLTARGMAGRDVFTRGMEAPEALGEPPLASVGLFKLLDAFAAVLAKSKQQALAFAVTNEGLSINDRMVQLVERLKGQTRCRFEDLFDDVATVPEIVVTFLAILELAKRRLARIYQSEPIAPIHLEYRVLEAEDERAALAEEVTADGGAPRREGTDPDHDEAIARAGEDPLGEVIDDGRAGSNALDAEDDVAHHHAPSGGHARGEDE